MRAGQNWNGQERRRVLFHLDLQLIHVGIHVFGEKERAARRSDIFSDAVACRRLGHIPLDAVFSKNLVSDFFTRAVEHGDLNIPVIVHLTNHFDQGVENLVSGGEAGEPLTDRVQGCQVAVAVHDDFFCEHTLRQFLLRSLIQAGIFESQAEL